MKHIFTILFTVCLFPVLSQELETVTVTYLRKQVHAIIGSETKVPKIGESLPLNATIQTKGMGIFEFKYKGDTFRVGKNTSALLSEVVTGDLQTETTDTGGVRADNTDPESKIYMGTGKGLKEKKKKHKSKKLRPKTEEEIKN